MGTDPLAGAGFDDADGFSTFFTLGPLLLAALGVAFVVGGALLVVRSRRRAADAARWAVEGCTTTGTVVDNRMESHPDRRMVFSPVVRFEADGREVTVVGDQRWNRSFVTGRPAQVVYDPATPDRAHVRAEGGSLIGSTGTGVFLIAAGVVFLVGIVMVSGLVRSVL